jgi:hypothetical protein
VALGGATSDSFGARIALLNFVTRPLRYTSCITVAIVGLATAGCSRQDERLQQHQEALQSLGASTAAIGQAWLAGSTSGTYTSTALEQMFVLVEQERTALTRKPASLADPRGAQLSQAAEHLSRLLAQMIDDVESADGRSVRRHLTEIPIVPEEPR